MFLPACATSIVTSADRLPRMPRRVLVSLCLGILTTVAVAWFLALAPTTHRWMGGALSADGIDAPNARYFDIEQERSRGCEWIQLSVKLFHESTFPNGVEYLAAAPAYATLGPILTIEPPWRFTLDTAPAVRGAIAVFPNLPGSAQAPPAGGDSRWPFWLPPIPASEAGLLSCGARASGWPLKSMRSVSRLAAVGAPLQWHGSLRILSETAYKSRAARGPQLGCIPVFPVPLAFAADTLLFAAFWSVPLVLPAMIRTRARRHRGRCMRCGYDLRNAPPTSNERCPECGATPARLTSPARERQAAAAPPASASAGAPAAASGSPSAGPPSGPAARSASAPPR
jgi:hypothetical protein